MEAAATPDAATGIVHRAIIDALVSNANIVGDSCNRGMLLGATLGSIFGASNLPGHLIEGLFRRDELRGLMAAFSGRVIAPQWTEASLLPASRRWPRFGRPWPLPLASYTGAWPIAAPCDFPAKAAAVAADLHLAAASLGLPLAAAAERLVYLRGHGPAVIVGSGVDAAVRLLPVRPDTPSEAAAVVCVLSALASARQVAVATPTELVEGDAAADRAEALAALEGAGAGAARGSTTATAASVSALPPASALHPWLLHRGGASRLALLHAAAHLDGGDALSCGIGLLVYRYPPAPRVLVGTPASPASAVAAGSV